MIKDFYNDGEITVDAFESETWGGVPTQRVVVVRAFGPRGGKYHRMELDRANAEALARAILEALQ